MAKRYGVFLVVLGVVSMTSGLWVEVQFEPKVHYAQIALKLLDEVGIALFLAGAVVVLLEFRDWQEYFQERIKKVIFDQDYLSQMGSDQLMALHTKTLRAFFRTDDIEREGSFLQFFRSQIQAYIGSPYREDVRDVIYITYSANGTDRVEVEETMSYRCRKVGEKIQDEVKWVETGTEQIKHIEFSYCQIEIRVPSAKFADFKKHHPDTPQSRVFKSTDKPNLIEFPGPGKGFVLPLQKYGYEVVDDIHVSIMIHYTVPTSLPFTWTMSHPTKGITGTVTYPQSLELVTNLFGLTEEQVHLKYNPGFCQVEYDSWLLPDTGFAFQLISKLSTVTSGALGRTSAPAGNPGHENA